MARRLRYRRLVWVGLVLLAMVGWPLPAAQAQGERCFAETGVCMSGRIAEFWEQNDGLRVFGLPVTPQRAEQIEGAVIEAQWFQRTRLELHPENPRPYDVLLGRMGDALLSKQGRNWAAFARSSPQGSCRFFAETGHNVCGGILNAWRASGIELDGQPGLSEAENLALWGLPLSDPRTETLSDDRQYTVQWFERARFEYHPIKEPPNDVLLGLLGNEILKSTKRTPLAADDRQQILFSTNRGVDEQLFPGADRRVARYIYSMHTNGSEQTNLTRNHVQRDERAAWSPDGTRIAFQSPRVPGQPADLYLMQPDGSKIATRAASPATDGYPAWSPDGNLLAFASERDDNWEVYIASSFDGSQLTNLSQSPTSQDMMPDWAPDASSIVFRSNRDGSDEIYLMNRFGGEQRRLTNTPAAAESDPVFSPDGSKIAFVTNRDGNREVYVMNADGSDPTNLSRHGGDDGEPTWSPDGTKIAFTSTRDGNQEIYVMGADGSGQQNLSQHPGDDADPDWSNNLPPAPSDPCPDVPEPVNASLGGPKCIRVGEPLDIAIRGFLSNGRFDYAYLAPGATQPVVLGTSNADAFGEKAGIRIPRFPSAGLWRVDFTFFFGEQAFYGATVYVRVDQ